MDSKLKAIRNGHKGAVSRLVKKFEDVKNDETAVEVYELSNIASALQTKLAVIIELNKKILEELQEKE